MDLWYLVAFGGGLVVFFGTHFFSAFRRRDGEGLVSWIGAGPYKGLYSVLTLAGFAALVWGYGNLKPWIYLAEPPSFEREWNDPAMRWRLANPRAWPCRPLTAPASPPEPRTSSSAMQRVTSSR